MDREDLQKTLEALGKGGITVNGDLVLEKHVEHEVGNVEAGGIGIQIVNGGQHAPENAEEQDVNKQPVNLVFKKFHEGKAIDFFSIRKHIEEKLVNDIKHQYEWYAAYRIVDDLRLLDDLKLTSFAEQMNKWFPDAKVPCDADTLGDYATGHTCKNFILWDEEKFEIEKKNNQTRTGFRKLWNLCNEIKDALKTVPTLHSRQQ